MKEQHFESSLAHEELLNDREPIDEDLLAYATPDDGTSARAGNRRHIAQSLAKRIAPTLMAVCDSKVHVCPDVLLAHASGTANPTTWVHCLVITGFSVFVIDYYEWRGTIKPTSNADELLIVDDLGITTVQTSPTRRAKPVVRYLRALLSQYGAPVESIAICAQSGCFIHPTVPDSVLQLPELYHFLRGRLHRFRANHSRYLDREAIAAQIDSCLHDSCTTPCN
ncbi:hypothetical protein [Caballeronia humi]|nr:hypothetical protein [Caballeronia humi]